MCAQFTIEIFFCTSSRGGPRPPRPPLWLRLCSRGTLVADEVNKNLSNKFVGGKNLEDSWRWDIFPCAPSSLLATAQNDSDNLSSNLPDSHHNSDMERRKTFTLADMCTHVTSLLLVRGPAISSFHTERVDASNQTNVKDRKHSHWPRRHASTNLHTPNERCQFKLYVGYWTSNNNKWPKCSCQTPPDNTCANDVIDNAMTTENEVIDSWMNMHTLLASRPNVIASTRVDALGLNGALRC